MNHLTSDTASAADTSGTTMSDVAALATLTARLPTTTVKAAVRTFETYQQLVATPLAERVRQLGQIMVHTQLPNTPEPVDDMNGTCQVVGRFDSAFPPELAEMERRQAAAIPLVVWVAGTIPSGTRVAVGGTSFPDPNARQHSRTAAQAAAAAGHTTVVVAGTTLGDDAATDAAAAGGKVLMLVPVGLRQLGAYQRLADAVIDTGGAVLSPVAPDGGFDEQIAAGLQPVAAALADSVHISQMALQPQGGRQLAQVAAELQRPLVVPRTARRVALAGVGSQMLADPRFGPAALTGDTPDTNDPTVYDTLEQLQQIVADTAKVR